MSDFASHSQASASRWSKDREPQPVVRSAKLADEPFRLSGAETLEAAVTEAFSAQTIDNPHAAIDELIHYMRANYKHN